MVNIRLLYNWVKTIGSYHWHFVVSLYSRFCWITKNYLRIDIADTLQVVLGKLKTLVNKFLGLNRLYGLIFVAVLITHTLVAPQTIFPQHRWHLKATIITCFYLETLLSHFEENIQWNKMMTVVQDSLLLSIWFHDLLLLLLLLVQQHRHCSHQVGSQLKIISKPCRFVFFKYPIETHNRYPTQNEKEELFTKLLG